MADIDSLDMPNQNELPDGNSGDYTERAAQACAAGDMVLGMHLYLAAYEKGLAEGEASDDIAINSLREAWHLACDLRERSIAEYVFEKLEPYLSGDEVQDCASMLQDLALDRLEEYGFSRDELEGVAQMITGDLLGGGAPIFQVEKISLPRRENSAEPPISNVGNEVAGDAISGQPSDQISAEPDFGRSEILVDENGCVTLETMGAPEAEAVEESSEASAAQTVPKVPEPQQNEHLTYRNLAGYDETMRIMRDFGVGLMDDPEFTHFVQVLNRHHGLTAMPSLDSMLFRAVAREDATRFVEATIGELGLPSLRMTMEENIQGIPILCVTAQSDNQPRLNQARNRFEGPAILVIEDMDLWMVPQAPEPTDGLGGFMMANITRGARAAFDLIRAAVEDPDVYVLATAQLGEEADPFFYDLLEPLSVVDIGYPTDKERRDIWHGIVEAHPSLRGIDRYDLVRYSAGMPRYDIYMAAREALEEAYKLGLMAREFVPVTPQNIFEKLAACQPLGSDEYKALEEAVVRDFRRDLDNLEDLLGDA